MPVPCRWDFRMGIRPLRVLERRARLWDGPERSRPWPPSPFPQGTPLDCSFGPQEIFEAVWVNQTAVRCDQVVVSGVPPLRRVPDPSLPPFT